MVARVSGFFAIVCVCVSPTAAASVFIRIDVLARGKAPECFRDVPVPYLVTGAWCVTRGAFRKVPARFCSHATGMRWLAECWHHCAS